MCSISFLGINLTKFTGKHRPATLLLQLYLKKRPWYRCFPVHFLKFLRTHLFKACNFIKKETLAQVFTRGFCQISKNTFLYRTPLVAASAVSYFCFEGI